MKKLLVLLGAVLIALGATALLLPERIVVERSQSINRPAATVFTLLGAMVQEIVAGKLGA